MSEFHPILDIFFRERVAVSDYEGMQIFRDLDEGRLKLDLVGALIFGLPAEVVEPPLPPVRFLAGLLWQTARVGKIPARWHIEYLEGRWFRKVEREANAGIDAIVHKATLPPEWVVECRLVVDEWKEAV